MPYSSANKQPNTNDFRPSSEQHFDPSPRMMHDTIDRTKNSSNPTLHVSSTNTRDMQPPSMMQTLTASFDSIGSNHSASHQQVILNGGALPGSVTYAPHQHHHLAGEYDSYAYHNNSGQYYARSPPGPPYTSSYYLPRLPHPPAWSMPPPSFVSVEYITQLGPEDVLSGRGGATNQFKGNRAFRALVKEYQKQYLQAKKREKPAVASIIVALIRKKGGRFLRRSDGGVQQPHLRGHVLWEDIGDSQAIEKTCQALREGAPEIRRKNHRPRRKNKSAYGSRSSSFDDEEEEETEKEAPSGFGNQQQGSTALLEAKDNDETFSSPSTNARGGGGTNSKGVNQSNADDDSDIDTQEVRNGTGNYLDEGPICIRPWARLIPERPPVGPIPLDQLSPQDRDMYLRDFLPPCPTVARNSDSQHCSQLPGHETVLSPMPYVDFNPNQHLEHPESTSTTWSMLKA